MPQGATVGYLILAFTITNMCNHSVIKVRGRQPHTPISEVLQLKEVSFAHVIYGVFQPYYPIEESYADSIVKEAVRATTA